MSKNILLLSGGIASLFGLFQYFYIPDIRQLKIYGWDDHYFRLVGVFLDPAFIGILLVLTLILGISKMKNSKAKYFFCGLVFLSILLTYSRASYLSLGVGLLILLLNKSKAFIRIIFFVAVFGMCIAILPRPSSEGVKLERTFSIVLRIRNYEETIGIWKTSPLFGIGYNNICFVKMANSNIQSNSVLSHSCNGADNSLLLILATTGVAGTLTLLNEAIKIVKKVPGTERSTTIALLLAVITHSFFANTLFYPWIMIWFSIYFSGVFTIQKK